MATQDNLNFIENNNEGGNTSPLTVNAQFLKDVTFENPDPKNALNQENTESEINVGIDVRVNQLAEKSFEVALHISAEAAQKDIKLFIVEVEYAGIFTLGELPEDAIHPVLMIECPRLLFPYARRIIADLTREGGYPALTLQPVDFVAMYRQQMERQQAEARKKQKH